MKKSLKVWLVFCLSLLFTVVPCLAQTSHPYKLETLGDMTADIPNYIKQSTIQVISEGDETGESCEVIEMYAPKESKIFRIVLKKEAFKTAKIVEGYVFGGSYNEEGKYGVWEGQDGNIDGLLEDRGDILTLDVDYDSLGLPKMIPYFYTIRMEFLDANAEYAGYMTFNLVVYPEKGEEVLEKLPALPNKGIQLRINSNWIESSQKPIVENGNTLVPLRLVAEKLKAQVAYDTQTGKIMITKPTDSYFSGKIEIECILNSKEMTVNGQKTTCDVAPKLINGITYIPLRFIAENLECFVTYDEEKSIIEIND